QEETEPVSAQPDQTASKEITKEITAAIIPITAASEKPGRVRRTRRSKKENKPTVGFEPTTCGLRNRCSTTELRRRNGQMNLGPHYIGISHLSITFLRRHLQGGEWDPGAIDIHAPPWLPAFEIV